MTIALLVSIVAACAAVTFAVLTERNYRKTKRSLAIVEFHAARSQANAATQPASDPSVEAHNAIIERTWQHPGPPGT